ncbi:hypothetical protein P8452_50329 [Trifolium repens]|nr:hypothetical protein P8452_50329 [Trifolium repens]
MVEPYTTIEKNPTKKGKRKDPQELTRPNMEYEISKVEEVEEKHEEKEGEKHIQVLEATIAKGKEDRGNQYVQEKNNKKGFQTQKTSEEEKVVKHMEDAKLAKSEETKDDSTFKRQDGKTTQAAKFDKTSSRSKRVGEKMLETSEGNHQRELEEVTSKMDNEIPKVKEFRKEEVERHIQELEANISKEKDRVEAKAKIYKKQLNHFPSSKEPFQQFEVEGEGKIKKNDSKLDVQESTKSKAGQEIEQYINKDMEAKHGIEEQKECEDETSEEKKYNKIPKVEKKKRRRKGTSKY